MQRRAPVPALSSQVETRLARRSEPVAEYKGSSQVVSTGSTLLDLAISGGRFETGGIPSGILVEIFGPSGSGKTVLLCEIAGAVQRLGGEVKFCDPEGRLNAQFASIFGFDATRADYAMPDTVTGLFEPLRRWEPKSEGLVNGVFADSLAALSTDMEMEGEDKYGMRRAKEFSEACRKVCRVLSKRGLLMVCSNQVRQNLDAGLYGEKYKSPGGEAIGFYSSLRLRFGSARKIDREREVGKGKQKRVVGVETMVEVYKSSVWEPFRRAPVCITYDYGIDDVRANLEFVKSTTGATVYMVGERSVGNVLERAVGRVEDNGLEPDLKKHTIQLWNEVEEKFKVQRKPKRRV